MLICNGFICGPAEAFHLIKQLLCLHYILKILILYFP